MSPALRNGLAVAFIVIGGGAAIALNRGAIYELYTGQPYVDRTPREKAFYGPPESVAFRDEANASNVSAPQGLSDLAFVDSKGQPVALSTYRGKSHVVLVVMRGFPGFVCPACTAQTSRLLKNAAEFEKRGASILVVFPGKAEAVPAFVDAVKAHAGAEPPFPILLDADYRLVDRLGIRGTEAKPSTYILDREGTVRFAYVGASTADRPSLKALVAQLDQINGGPPAEAAELPANQ